MAIERTEIIDRIVDLDFRLAVSVYPDKPEWWVTLIVQDKELYANLKRSASQHYILDSKPYQLRTMDLIDVLVELDMYMCAHTDIMLEEDLKYELLFVFGDQHFAASLAATLNDIVG